MDLHNYSKSNPKNPKDYRYYAPIWFERRWEFLFTKCGFNPAVRGIVSSEAGIEAGAGGFKWAGFTAQEFEEWCRYYATLQTTPLIIQGTPYPSPFIASTLFQWGDTNSGSGGWAGYSLDDYVPSLEKFWSGAIAPRDLESLDVNKGIVPVTPLSQRDRRWGKTLLGNSQKENIHNYGCLVTSIAMIARSTPPEVNQKLVRNGCFHPEPNGAYISKLTGYESFGLPRFAKVLGAYGEYRFRPFDHVKELLDAPYAIVEVNFRRITTRAFTEMPVYHEPSVTRDINFSQHFLACVDGEFFDPWFGDKCDVGARYGSKSGEEGIADAVCRVIL
jgi:hypothetical protein